MNRQDAKNAKRMERARDIPGEHLPSPSEDGEDPTLALFARWEQEDARMTPEEIEQERRVWEEFEAGINETRRASGMREL